MSINNKLISLYIVGVLLTCHKGIIKLSWLKVTSEEHRYATAIDFYAGINHLREILSSGYNLDISKMGQEITKANPMASLCNRLTRTCVQFFLTCAVDTTFLAKIRLF